MTSATERLRALLDERGVEWTEPTVEYWELLGGMPTRNYVTIIGEINVEEALDGTLAVYRLTPEQAVAATLGPGTCHNECKATEFFFYCSECGCAHKRNRAYVDMPHYCPNCGKRVVIA